MTREELIAYDRWLTENKWGSSEIITPEQAADLYLAEHPLPPAEGAEEILLKHGFFVMTHKEGSEHVRKVFIEPVIAAMYEFATLHAQRIAEKMVEKKSPSNEQIHEAALAWARDHSEAPDKDCPDWLIRDYEAGAYFVRQCYGCLNKTDNLKIRER